MNEAETLKLNRIECDKCCGTGFVYGDEIHLLIKRWRIKLGVTAKTLAALSKIPYTSYCKFENGRIVFSEKRLRKLIESMQIMEEPSTCECAIREHGLTTCPRCDRPYYTDGSVFLGRYA